MAASTKKKTASPAKSSARKKTASAKTKTKAGTRSAAAKSSTKSKTKSGSGTGTKSKTASRAGSRAGNQSVRFDFSILKDVLFILFVVFCLLLFISCFVSSGSVLRWMHDTSFSLFGYLAYTVPFLLIILVLYCLFGQQSNMFALRITSGVLMFCAAAAILSVMYLSGYSLKYGGGKLGDAIVGVTMKSFGLIGSYLLMAAVIIIALLLFFGRSLLDGVQSTSEAIRENSSAKKQLIESNRELRAGRKRLEKEQKVNQRLKEQGEELARLQKQTEETISSREKLRDFIGYRVEENQSQPAEYEASKAGAQKANAQKNSAVKETDFDEVIPAGDDAADAQAVALLAQKAVYSDNTGKTREESGRKSRKKAQPDKKKEPVQEKPSAFPEDGGGDFWNPEYGDEAAGEAGFDDTFPEEIELRPAQKPSGRKMSNLDRDQDYTPQTRTVMTSTGKIISVELDGLPGERKLPKEAPVKNEDEIIVNQEEEKKEYVFPPTDLLTYGAGGKTDKEEIARNLAETAGKLQSTLKEFGVGVTVTDISRGPTVTRYELQPEHGVKVSRIVSLTDDIKLNLAAEDIRIEAPIPGKAAIGIEVPNKEKLTVALRELLESDEFRNNPSRTVFCVGKDISGRTVIADIEKMPHLLIAGQTGSGKSVCINTIILSIIYKASPSDVKLLMIDPKVVELSVYNGIPHLLIPVVTDAKKAAGALNWVVNEMEERYKKFSKLKVRNISGYNAAVEQHQGENEKDPPKKMPQVVVIVDELADLIMAAAGDVEDSIQRLAQKARAAGIHLILATQRPSVNVITGVIKANIPSRIAFGVASGVDSRTILDSNGAEKLLGKGDMLFYPYYLPKPIRVQGAFVNDDEVAAVAAFLQQQDNVEGGEMDKTIDLSSSQSQKTGAEGRDELFVTAAEFICHQEKATIGNLQRHLKIGFNRAARIMDQMYEAGIVSKDEGTKARQVLMTPEQLTQFFEEDDEL